MLKGAGGGGEAGRCEPAVGETRQVVVVVVDVMVVEDAMYALAIVPWSVCRSARA